MERQVHQSWAGPQQGHSGRLAWYWKRFRAMSPTEVASHVRKKVYQWSDSRTQRRWFEESLVASGGYPVLPPANGAPKELRKALTGDSERILSGRWQAFRALELKVDDPPQWHKDYLAGVDLQTRASAFQLNHRQLPGGADVKLIWELSRWNECVRLAQAAYVSDLQTAGRKCLDWLRDWAIHNPPYVGWNWTSALESGLRLIQFSWIDALLRGSDARLKPALDALGGDLVPAHARFTWRYRSTGSSANNHALGELAGLIVAGVRWPELQRWSAPLQTLKRLWEMEVLAQFAPDGGNREQALNYHLFGWEFCWQAQQALEQAGLRIDREVKERLRKAAQFLVSVQVPEDPWHYGDSDDAFVTPFFLSSRDAGREWYSWLRESGQSRAIEYWWGQVPFRPRARTVPQRHWFGETGILLRSVGGWRLRWDLSPLGYLATAAHGHLDALHLSLWYQGVALVVDPGTGAYYPDPALREYLASWAAHNGPVPVGVASPRRAGPFLWADRHAKPAVENWAGSTLSACLELSVGTVQRRIIEMEGGRGWRVEDQFVPTDKAAGQFTVHWQFAPGTNLEKTGPNSYRLSLGSIALSIKPSPGWVVASSTESNGGPGPGLGMTSPSFRVIAMAPWLELVGRGQGACQLATEFLLLTT